MPSGDVEQYLDSYLTLEAQDPQGAPTDPQLAALMPLVLDRLSLSASGTVVDIGCGAGTLFARLAEFDAFRANAGWIYAGVDDEDALAKLFAFARPLGLGRRIELVTRDDFYSKWPHLGHSQVIVCRNVLHEIDISSTSRLFSHISMHMGAGDALLLQDLLKLPKAERHSACWTANGLEACLKSQGYSPISVVPQKTRSGNAWVTIAASRERPSTQSLEEVHRDVLKVRREQWNLWSNVERESTAGLPRRNEVVEALDLDLQLAALTRQLRDAGSLGVALEADVSRRVRNAEVTRPIAALVAGGTLSTARVDEYVHFRERGEQLDKLEQFLRDQRKLAIIHGGAGTGKTTLARRLLSVRAYSKAVILIDGRRTRNVWAFIEELFSQVGLNLAPELLSVLDNLSLTNVEQPLRQFFNRYASSVIILIDDFDQILDSNTRLTDPSLETLLELILSKDGAKVMLAGRSEFVPARLQAAGGLPVAVRVGRYATEQTVKNVLDDYFDRSAAGLVEYPEALLSAIDRHPLITALAARILQRRGAQQLLDENFIRELKGRLREDLWARLVDDESLPAVEAASNLRVAVPQVMLEALASSAAISAAKESELVYGLSDERWGELLASLGLFRLREVADGAGDVQNQKGAVAFDHSKAAKLYREIYRIDDDPKWVRESYFHQLIAQESQPGVLSHGLGKYYFEELIASADYAFTRRRDYRLALDLYNIALGLGPLPESPAMRRASCLIRRRRRVEGEDAYAALCREFPRSIGIKTSHVDALLYVDDYVAARETLLAYHLEEADSFWISYQWGRIYLGLHNYEAAIKIFERLIQGERPDSYFYVHLARALQQFGDLGGAISTLRTAARIYPANVAVLTSPGADLERMREDEEALKVLLPLFESDASGIRAALSIIRIYNRANRRDDARAVLRRAERYAPSDMSSFTATARVEVMFAFAQWQEAVEYLRVEKQKDPSLVGLFLEAIVRAASGSSDSALANQYLREGVAAAIPEELTLNVPVQVNRARLGVAAKDSDLFEGAMHNLRQTRIDRRELERLQELWDAQ